MKPSALVGMAVRDANASRSRSVISVLGIALGVAVLMVITALGLGVRDVVMREVVRELPVDMIEVVPKSMDLGLLKMNVGTLFGGSSGFDDGTAQNLAAVPGVSHVYPKLEVKLPLAARGGQRIFGQNLYAEMFVNGLPEELVQVPEFRDNSEYVPVVISGQLMEMFNTAVAPALNFPQFTGETIKGFEFQLSIGRSLLLGTRGAKSQALERARVVGVSPYAIRLGASVPLATARRLIETYAIDAGEVRYSSIIVRAGRPTDVPEVTARVRALGYEVDDTAKRTSDLITLGTALASLVGVLVLALAALNIAHSFFASLSERRRELAVLRSVGARRGDILMLVLAQAALLGISGGVVGAASAFGVTRLIDFGATRLAPDFPFKPDSFFVLPAWLTGVALAGAVAAACLGALWPAIRASRASITSALAE